jgi:hypothetical protein
MDSERPVHRMTNSIRLCVSGEPAGKWRSPNTGALGRLALSAELACQGGLEGRNVVGDGMVCKVLRVNRGDLKPHRARQLTAAGLKSTGRLRLQESERP